MVYPISLSFIAMASLNKDEGVDIFNMKTGQRLRRTKTITYVKDQVIYDDCIEAYLFNGNQFPHPRGSVFLIHHELYRLQSKTFLENKTCTRSFKCISAPEKSTLHVVIQGLAFVKGFFKGFHRVEWGFLLCTENSESF